MIVARQFIAWNMPNEENRPAGYGMIVALIGWVIAFCATGSSALLQTSSQHGTSGVTIPHTVPYRTDPFPRTIQAINCLATII